MWIWIQVNHSIEVSENRKFLSEMRALKTPVVIRLNLHQFHWIAIKQWLPAKETMLIEILSIHISQEISWAI